MIFKLSNGNEIIIDDVAKDEKAEAIEWLRKYKARRQAIPGSRKEYENGEAQDKLDC